MAVSILYRIRPVPFFLSVPRRMAGSLAAGPVKG